MLLINTFNLRSTQTGEAFEPPKLKQNRVLEWLPFTSITYSLLNTTPPSTSKLPHFSSWDLAMQSTGSGSWAYETPLHPGSPIPALLSIYPSPLQSAAQFPPPPAFSSRGLSCKERHANLGFDCYQQIKYKSELICIWATEKWQMREKHEPKTAFCHNLTSLNRVLFNSAWIYCYIECSDVIMIIK